MGSTYATGWETLGLPIVAVDLEYQERSGATSYVTTLSFSNRRAPFTGAAFQRPSVVGQPFGIASFTGADTLAPSSEGHEAPEPSSESEAE